MATNKHAMIRYQALDKCFRNPGRRYYIDDLINECNEAISNFAFNSDGIKRRQLFEDIRFMESPQGWSIPLERHKDGKTFYYRYSDISFSINNQSINESEANQLIEVINLLSRFKGMPQFEWIEEMLIRIESTFNLKGNNNAIVGFEQNPYLKGLNFFTDLFNAIHYKKVLSIKYKSFNQPTPFESIIHPYFLKQYNSRWFLFGYNAKLKTISNLALDRIIEIKETNKAFIENETLDFQEYFDDVVGVTIKDNCKPSFIQLQIGNKLWPYIETKPIHGSQKIKKRNEDHVIIELSLQINYELAALIFSLGEEVKVIAPVELQEIINNKAKNLLKNYS